VRVVGHNIHWPRLDFGENAVVEVFDLKRHEPMFANALTRRKRLASYSCNHVH
jgi:hypothetical protein